MRMASELTVATTSPVGTVRVSASPVSAHLVGRAAYRNRRVDSGTLEVDELSDALERSGWDPTG